MVLDAEATDLPCVQLVEGVDAEGGSQHDLEEVAVGESVLIDLPELLVGLEGLRQVFKDQATDVPVGVDQQGPALVAGLLGEEVPQGDSQPRLRLAAGFQVGKEEGELRPVSGPVHQDDLGSGVVTEVLIHLPQGEVPGAKQDGKPVLLGPTIDRPCPGTDHSLRVAQDDEGFAFQRIELVDHPLLYHVVRMPHHKSRGAKLPKKRLLPRFQPSSRPLSPHRCVPDCTSAPTSQ